MEISIGVGVKVSETEKYNMDLNIPCSEITKDKPFHFSVTQITPGSENENVMEIAFADVNHIYLEVKPPKSIMHAAGVDEYVDNLKAIVKEGNYVDKKFVDSNELPDEEKLLEQE